MSATAKGLILLCRPGFENECAAEAEGLAQRAGMHGRARTAPNSGSVHFVFDEVFDWDLALQAAPFHSLVFARQRSVWLERVANMPEDDRVTPLMRAILDLGIRFGRLEVETADTNEAKTLSGFLKRFIPHIERQLKATGFLRNKPELPTLHLFFKDSSQVDLGLSKPDDASPWNMGIARLRMPRNAPSRSTLKLAEAFDALMTEEEREQSLRAGLYAVDLGAAPGGWSFQFAERGIHVFAVDNGPLADSLKATGMVEHVKADGFNWRAPRKQVEWLVCDMVEQPARVAQLVSDWVASGKAKRCIFNLKLPMKKRFDELKKCRQIIDSRFKLHGDSYVLRIKHLYHDREEVTAYLAKLHPHAAESDKQYRR
ncbi:23S rRNA (cytidine(2498)-2'-O)-methyltransferase RlmM [Uliginosibacterium sp. 31-16]|uniref:23S rRNA (cytidine(2498)-2'-O)-methyltransferase RlmM n=1 Tax=Uliginosibacterium sp. 31-16 TaxID=3068315 RepID=UPI00273D755C|nr:23S rRNA (cytidine(2498)-2'-O)-methyltransferase RlmM [Uliginosibacterium sp. 31-16]MDP5238355.1 23S rRNA (cytidine(2498)-2'-O)-methyltransferase RlmM [Uliginosibacterium sp. 31-16]